MRLIENGLYKEDIEIVAGQTLPWEKLKDSSLLLSGATGFMGSFLVDVLMYLNNELDLNCKVSSFLMTLTSLW